MSASIDPGSVAVIVLNWNGASDTIRCLESISALRPAPGTLRVIDNASTDDSVERIRQAFPSITLTRNRTNLGFGAGQNAVIEELIDQGYAWIWLVNNDARVETDALAGMLQVAGASPTAGVIGAVIRDLAPPHRVQACGGGMIHWWTGRSVHASSPQPAPDYITGACMMIRAAALRRTGLFDAGYFMYWEDADLCIRMTRYGYSLEVARDVVVHHRLAASSITEPARREAEAQGPPATGREC